eukprot:10817346-Prorocentrum_lima.AAC.1
MDLFCMIAPVQMSSALWEVEHPIYIWEDTSSCYVSSHDEEEPDTGEVELYLPSVMAHWHSSCPQA